MRRRISLRRVTAFGSPFDESTAIAVSAGGSSATLTSASASTLKKLGVRSSRPLSACASSNFMIASSLLNLCPERSKADPRRHDRRSCLPNFLHSCYFCQTWPLARLPSAWHENGNRPSSFPHLRFHP